MVLGLRLVAPVNLGHTRAQTALIDLSILECENHFTECVKDNFPKKCIFTSLLLGQHHFHKYSPQKCVACS